MINEEDFSEDTDGTRINADQNFSSAYQLFRRGRPVALALVLKKCYSLPR